MTYREQISQYEPRGDQEVADHRLMMRQLELFGDALLYRDNGISHLTASGFIMDDTFKKVLLIHHKVYDAWGWTGGHVDGEEDLLAVALKEAREETGLSKLRPLTNEILSLDILPVFGHMKKGAYVSGHLHLNVAYVLIGDPNQALTLNQEETNGVMWADVADVKTLCREPELVKIYEKLISRAIAHGLENQFNESDTQEEKTNRYDEGKSDR